MAILLASPLWIGMKDARAIYSLELLIPLSDEYQLYQLYVHKTHT